MPRDTSDALRRLEEALLEEEAYAPQVVQEEDSDLLDEDLLDELLEDTAPGKDTVAYQNFSNDYGNDEEEDLLEEEYIPLVKKKDNFGFVIALCLLLMLGLCVAAFYLLRRGGLV